MRRFFRFGVGLAEPVAKSTICLAHWLGSRARLVGALRCAMPGICIG